MRKKIIAVLALTFGLAACANSQFGQKQQVGSAAGGVLGGLAGAQFGSGSGQVAAAAIGTLIGALIGSDAGRSLDRSDQLFEQRLDDARRQVPSPGFSPFDLPGRQRPSTSSSVPSSAASVQRESLFEDHPPGCRKLDGGFRAAFACRDDIGRWFVLQ
jgi:predicted lipid-binding transport protein (Tim44 family)